MLSEEKLSTDLNTVSLEGAKERIDEGLNEGAKITVYLNRSQSAEELRDYARDKGYDANYSQHERYKSIWVVKIVYAESS